MTQFRDYGIKLSLFAFAVLTVATYQNCSGQFVAGNMSEGGPFSEASLNAECGGANGVASQTLPTINLCSDGATPAVSGAGPFLWECGSGGTAKQCSAALTGPYFRVSAGTHHTCAIKNGDVWCWGDNSFGELGNGTTVASLTAVKVIGLPNPVDSIAVGVQNSCALTGGRVWCWGSGYYGNLGNGSTSNSALPLEIDGLIDVSSISSGGSSVCAIRAGSPICWGNDYGGVLTGISAANDSIISVPTPISGILSASTIGAGRTSTCAVSPRGAVSCWGSNARGQMGLGTSTLALFPPPNSPQVVIGLDKNVTTVGTGDAYSCALTTDGKVSCWGNGDVGQLGNAKTDISTLPSLVIGLPGRVQKISVGMNSACALVSGDVYCWGAVINGSTFNAVTLFSSNIATRIFGFKTAAIDITSGGSNAICADFADGSVQCFGVNNAGQLGNNSTTDSLVPTEVRGL